MPNLFPSISAPAISTPQSQIIQKNAVWGGAPLFDPVKKEFVIDSTGNVVIGSDYQAVVQWIRKSLATAKFRWKIYLTPTLGYFGSELLSLVGKNYAPGVIINLAKKFAAESIKYDSRIQSVNTDAVAKADQLYISVQVVLVSGKILDIQQNWTLR